VADQLLALAGGEILQPVTADEQPGSDLSIRPSGFTEQHMLNMRHGYINGN